MLKDFGNIVWKRHSDQLMPRCTPTVPSDGTVSRYNTCSGESFIPMSPSDQVCNPSSTELSDNPVSDENSFGSDDNSNTCIPSNVPDPVPLRRSNIVKPPDRLNL